MKNNLEMLFLKVLRKFKAKFFGKKRSFFFNQQPPQYNSQKASDIIKDLLESEKPCMIARFGSVELDCLDCYKEKQNNLFKRYFRYINENSNTIDWTEEIRKSMLNNAGFFPVDDVNLTKFSQLMLKSISNLDILGSWLQKENNFKIELSDVKTVPLTDLEPYYHKQPWSIALKNKKVLVIHPFVKSIKSQYENRKLLFKNPDVLPDFDLITYKPVQSFAGNHKNIDFKTWFEALEFMKKDIHKIEFDIAIIGCGAYGFPLASFIKEIGKKSIHLGGATQVLFGIKGKRWEEEYDMSAIFNDHWIRPLDVEKPENFLNVENGCYW
ncbi:hypothetical protein [Flavobacterium sp.]|uniref:hypothetical protein n=1 Tax=Flavobacterium sp. TaxID=239 RepID=UPI0031D8DA70